MLMTREWAEYMAAVIKAVENNGVGPGSRRVERMETLRGQLTMTCPECGVDLTEVMPTPHPDDPHVYASVAKPDGKIDFILVACEGYWVIDPNVVGIHNPNWHDWTGELSTWRFVAAEGR